MKLFKHPAAVIVIAGTLVLVVLGAFGMSDNEAIEIAKGFFQKTGVRVTSEPWVYPHGLIESITGCKEVVVGERNHFWLDTSVSIRSREVIYFQNKAIRSSIFDKLQRDRSKAQEDFVRNALPEAKANDIIRDFASKVGLPDDVEMKFTAFNKEYGLWGGYWQRKYKTYQYEDDGISLQILAADGRLYSYRKSFSGTQCPTVVTITREKAEELARNKVSSLLGEERSHLQDYVVSSPELKIVQPNAIFGWFSPFHRATSRLAWVVVYTVKDSKLELTIGNANFSERFVIKIDAATGKVIGGSSAR